MTIYDKKPLPDGVSAAGRGLQPRPAIRRSDKKMKPDTETEIRIADIRNCPEVIPVLAQWFEDEFGYEDVTKEDETSWLEQSLQTDEGLPTTLVAYAGGILVGTARIFTDEMDDRPQYNPWFGYWFVLPSHRKQGIGTALDQARLKAAKKEMVTEQSVLLGEKQCFLSRSRIISYAQEFLDLDFPGPQQIRWIRLETTTGEKAKSASR